MLSMLVNWAVLSLFAQNHSSTYWAEYMPAWWLIIQVQMKIFACAIFIMLGKMSCT